MKRPIVTISIPFRDPGPVFELAIRSIFAQTFEDWELILCNDGSQDDSVKLALSVADPRVRVLNDGLRKTLANRLNESVSVAKGDFFFRMDADDVMHPDRISRQVEMIDRNPECVVGSAGYALDADDNVTGFKPALKRGSRGFGSRHSFYHPTVAARTAWFRRNPYNESPLFYRCEDAELWCRTSNSNSFLQIEEPLLYIREVGVFSITKYLGTGLGVLHLAQQHGRNRLERLYQTNLQIAKLWIMCGLDTFGKADWIVHRRAIPLDAAAAAIAAEGLTRVRRAVLPLENRNPVYASAALAASGAGGGGR